MRKLIWVAGFVLAFAVPTLAQQEVNLKVTTEDVNVIGKALGKMPFDEVAGLIQKLREQIMQQQKPAEVPVPTPRPAEAPKKE